ncbi:lysine decarboxylase [Paraliobacillus quinghaiensis]|uniref:Lysine decarboxylase n=1 Tax=Paraliobacillus quinghaiensis TaxID=470815 RepID=A0A917TTL1_9BACI|nr:aminotransferase class I/II-fold pyridoxal phosphate-dependent enzyme [Paraliobacillus quinghaiensis]GGM36863.1 lysine decarboxylase [Paraliobacillus quinghaiensis]
MDKQQQNTPLFNRLKQFTQDQPLSFHVPGHKNGLIFPKEGRRYFNDILRLDLTELTGLDDLHAPNDVIAEAQCLARDWFRSDYSYFLVNGSTVGNLAMILATCNRGEKVIVQRNSHKSILNGLELSGARPVFVSPEFDQQVKRYTAPSIEQLKQAIHNHPDAKAIILTYPDYFGHTSDIKSVINTAHQYKIPVLVDEAHGVHFSIDAKVFPMSALELGADLVIQSAHKMAPAMTMTAFLHIKSSYIPSEKIEHYLQMLQSSSPSYPLMASLDLARYFLAMQTKENIQLTLNSIEQMRHVFSKSNKWDLIPIQKERDDPLKITLNAKPGYSAHSIAALFESEGVFPEMRTEKQILFIHGLKFFDDWKRLEKVVEKVTRQLKFSSKHATIESKQPIFPEVTTVLAYSYGEMEPKEIIFMKWSQIIGKVAAEAITPYPPGIPIVVKGERITEHHIKVIHYLLEQQINFQQDNIQEGMRVFKGE